MMLQDGGKTDALARCAGERVTDVDQVDQLPRCGWSSLQHQHARPVRLDDHNINAKNFGEHRSHAASRTIAS